MNKKLRKLLLLLMTMAMVLTFSFTALAVDSAEAQEMADVNLPEEELANGYQLKMETRVVGVRLNYGGWRIGPTGRGPGTLSINEGTNIDRSFTATISGSALSEREVGATLGVEIGVGKSYGTSYTITLGANETKTIRFRPKYNTNTVEQKLYQIDTRTGERTLVSSSTCYVNTFSDWDYDWVYGYGR